MLVNQLFYQKNTLVFYILIRDCPYCCGPRSRVSFVGMPRPATDLEPSNTICIKNPWAIKPCCTHYFMTSISLTKFVMQEIFRKLLYILCRFFLRSIFPQILVCQIKSGTNQFNDTNEAYQTRGKGFMQDTDMDTKSQYRLLLQKNLITPQGSTINDLWGAEENQK